MLITFYLSQFKFSSKNKPNLAYYIKQKFISNKTIRLKFL